MKVKLTNKQRDIIIKALESYQEDLELDDFDTFDDFDEMEMEIDIILELL